MPHSRAELMPELRHMVSASGALLGEIIRRERGEREYRFIEATRREMASLRGLSIDRSYLRLKRRLDSILSLPHDERRAMAHAYSLLLELMNACENAWRTYRLKQKQVDSTPFRSVPDGIVSVLTAHPTEARSPDNVALFHRIQELILEGFEKGARGWKAIEARLEHELELAWHAPIARNRKPRVEDEAVYLYSILLKPEILNAILEANETVPFYFRSWVGGDKDGHPGVDERATHQSLEASRTRLYAFANRHLENIARSIQVLPPDFASKKLKSQFGEVVRQFRTIKKIESGDGGRIQELRHALRRFAESYSTHVHAQHPSLGIFRKLFHVFPGLVIPLELRESSDLLIEAVAKRGLAIERMLTKIRTISRGGNPRWYARGLVISMTRNFDDIQSACSLVRRVFGELELPVIPLFEQASVLELSCSIVSDMLTDRKIRAAIPKYWNGFLEVMLGYSDSAKEMGVLPSRLAIARTVRDLDRLCRKRGVSPLFFHGSGGSVDRGGGSIEEQTAAWPRSALALYKVTVQGEMVERAFSTPEITQRQMEAVVRQWEKRIHTSSNRGSKPDVPGESPVLQRFADRVSSYYRAKVSSPEFLEVVQKATPYSQLQKLRIGSRPSKRTGALSVASLRAIPWVLCWTQTRTLFPTWWGIGSAWAELRPSEKRELKAVFKRDALFRSYVKLLGFTLAKVELSVWRLYLERSALPSELVKKTYEDFERELFKVKEFFYTVSGEKDYLWYRGWLGESIRLRSPMIHPLNLLQIANRGSRDVLLTRETVTGIASGMLTTG
jgi:phosphoenolpyruvate carboxylase